ncbi:hypothetical protein DFP72DRAFT_972963 [Ephemerocybe angulata]|uniref:Fungal defensin Copsin domain-containing protein n=1 Tax=Ephemerocybe angulata TaxID=980116 RepID=A0A8H6M042_9AGAR|nr:hypothetical protein DFP72DRAFT_972963 [Tulosesus angulatus]
MKFTLAPVLALALLSGASFGLASSTSNSAAACVHSCFQSAATSVGCAISNHVCVKNVVTLFEEHVQQCLVAKKCTHFPDVDGDETAFASDAIALQMALRPQTEFDGMLSDNTSTTLTRVIPRGSSFTERACNSASGLCVLSSSRCNTYCKTCHAASNGGCTDCSEGICAGFLGLTCVCQTPCRSC